MVDAGEEGLVLLVAGSSNRKTRNWPISNTVSVVIGPDIAGVQRGALGQLGRPADREHVTVAIQEFLVKDIRALIPHLLGVAQMNIARREDGDYSANTPSLVIQVGRILVVLPLVTGHQLDHFQVEAATDVPLVDVLAIPLYQERPLVTRETGGIVSGGRQRAVVRERGS